MTGMPEHRHTVASTGDGLRSNRDAQRHTPVRREHGDASNASDSGVPVSRPSCGRARGASVAHVRAWSVSGSWPSCARVARVMCACGLYLVVLEVGIHQIEDRNALSGDRCALVAQDHCGGRMHAGHLTNLERLSPNIPLPLIGQL